MWSSIRNVSHPAEQEMMKLPAQVCGECVMWTVAHYSIVHRMIIVVDYYL